MQRVVYRRVSEHERDTERPGLPQDRLSHGNSQDRQRHHGRKTSLDGQLHPVVVREVHVKSRVETRECPILPRVGAEPLPDPGALLDHRHSRSKQVLSMTHRIGVLQFVFKRVPAGHRRAGNQHGHHQPEPTARAFLPTVQREKQRNLYRRQSRSSPRARHDNRSIDRSRRQ